MKYDDLIPIPRPLFCIDDEIHYGDVEKRTREIEIYGSIAWSSSGYDTGEACHPLQAFQRFCFNEPLGNTYPWLRDVASASFACAANYNGGADNCTASLANSVLGLIAIK